MLYLGNMKLNILLRTALNLCIDLLYFPLDVDDRLLGDAFIYNTHTSLVIGWYLMAVLAQTVP